MILELTPKGFDVSFESESGADDEALAKVDTSGDPFVIARQISDMGYRAVCTHRSPERIVFQVDCTAPPRRARKVSS